MSFKYLGITFYKLGERIPLSDPNPYPQILQSDMYEQVLYITNVGGQNESEQGVKVR